MNIGKDVRGRRIAIFGQKLPAAPALKEAPRADWMQANPLWIKQTLERVQALPSGGWYVLDACRRITGRPAYYMLDRHELVVWRDGRQIKAAPNSCPHMGAPLSAGRVSGDKLVCPWHGLALGPEGHGSWRQLETYDDGVLCWVRHPGAETPTAAPILPGRPQKYIADVIRLTGRCEPGDIIANRMDPWHGAHFHYHSFARLKVLSREDDVLKVRVAFRALGPLCVEVDCTFHCPEPHTIVMTIVAGEGAGSVVETHATPVAPGWSSVVEATLATSERLGFQVARLGAALIRPFIGWTAGRLWVEDLAYAERRYHLRQGAPLGVARPEGLLAAPGSPR